MDNKRRTVIGILAHVDAGKTTLAEAMLYAAGKIRSQGRVDHASSYLDNFALERERGITIFAKEAVLELPHTSVTLLDTPGHADLAPETERSLPAVDCVVLVISGSDGLQAHTETLWKLLESYGLPCIVFVTKMDMARRSREELMAQLRRGLGEGCVDFTSQRTELWESAALLSDWATEKYLEKGVLEDGDIRALIEQRALFPCFFGSGLKGQGVKELLDAIDRLAPCTKDKGSFAAKVFKIARDAQGQRLSYLKLTGGSLTVRETLRYTAADGSTVEEKIKQLRIYSGGKFDAVERVEAGQICAIPGLTMTRAGQGLGAESDEAKAFMKPVMDYRIILPEGCDPVTMQAKLAQLGEEEPQLNLSYDAKNRCFSVQLMGRIQTEIFKSLVKDRFDIDIDLDKGHILYRETIADMVEGVGHFEPLRHYAEVHLIMEPLPAGSGIELCSSVGEDELDRNWQRLIFTNLAEKQHLGVLTGSPITDIRITLASGRAHLKHTEGGDFREACYRAVRQGLMQAQSVLLEPWCDFRMSVPVSCTGRAIGNLRGMNGEFDSPTEDEGLMCFKGSAPAAAIGGYIDELISYTRGKGRLTLSDGGYRPCKEQEKICEAIGYDAQADRENTADSVFCAHGGGFNVKWDKVKEYMHLDSCLKPKREPDIPAIRRTSDIDERELEDIMLREFGPIKRPEYRAAVVNAAPSEKKPEAKKQFIIVDGYNLIYSWEPLKKIAGDNLELARQRLMDILSSYCGFTGARLVLVFDAYRRDGSPGSRTDYHNIHVAYTKTGETGDAYIERLADEIGLNYAVRVVTSDNLIRLSALRSGVLRCSSAEFGRELEQTLRQIDAVLQRSNQQAHTTRLGLADRENDRHGE